MLSLVFERIADPALNYVVEGTSDLVAGPWAPVWTSAEAGAVSETTTVTAPDIQPIGARRFLRLIVTRNPAP